MIPNSQSDAIYFLIQHYNLNENRREHTIISRQIGWVNPATAHSRLQNDFFAKKINDFNNIF